MKGQVYHSSVVSGLKELKPSFSSHRKSYVYATKSRIISVIFICSAFEPELEYRLTGLGTKEDPAILVERRKYRFEQIFSAKGSLYTLDGKNFRQRKTKWAAEVVSEQSETILKEEEITDVFAEFQKAIDNGTLKLYRYPRRPEDMPLDNSDLIDRFLNFYKRGFINAIRHLLIEYPEFKEEVEKRMKEM